MKKSQPLSGLFLIGEIITCTKKLLNPLLLLVLVLFFIVSPASAQKPKPSGSLEIKLSSESDAWHFDGNKRILNRTGHPTAIYQGKYRVSGADPETQAREYLSGNMGEFGLNAADVQNLRLHAIKTGPAGTVVRLRQTWKGLPVNNNAEITIHINSDKVVDFVMNGFVYGIHLDNINPVVSPATARQQVVSHLKVLGGISNETNKLMVFHHQNSDYLVYRVNLATDNPVGDWEAYIDAKTGSILKVEDISYNHHEEKDFRKPLPIRSPKGFTTVNGTGNIFNPDPLSTAHVAYGGSYVDGSDANTAALTAELSNVTLQDITLTAGTYSLVGPYAAIVDFEAPFNGLFTQVSPAFNFDRNADAFEAVNTYYHVDAAMRYLNVTLGLSIMPYQYTGGVRCDPSGLNGADNSHYLGGTGKIAFGEGGVDDAEDADVIIHELGHGIHDWATSGGLSQVNGLSEGCGDYWAASYSRALGNWATVDAAYNWVFNWDGHNPFWGGRVVNYAPIYPGGLVGQIHTDGQIWATAMMKVWDDIGRIKADKAFWSGIALTNSSSSQNDAANAVYQAAINMGYTNAERLAIHTRFTAAGYTLPAFVSCPTVNAPTVTQPSCATPAGTIVVNATGSGTLEYSINNGSNWFPSASFSGLAAGSYNIVVRSQANPACTSPYAGNPVVLIAATGCCTPPTITCPAAVTVNNTPGQCGANVTYPAATPTGTSPTITYSHASGTFFPVGTTIVTATATNDCGSAHCTFTVTVMDITPPTLTVPANVTLQCSDPLPLPPLNINSSPIILDGTYNMGTAVFGPPLTATPVTGDLELVNDLIGNPADACDPVTNNFTGKIAVVDRGTCLFTDKVLGAQNAGAIAVIVVNNQPGDNIITMGGTNPAITIPSVFVSNNYGNALKASMALGIVNVSLTASTVLVGDCSSVAIIFTEGVTPGSCPSSYSILRTWTVTDSYANATSASQTITVVDNTPPTLTVPANVTLQCSDPMPLMPLNINSSPHFIDGTYNVGTAVFGAPLTATPLTANAILVNDGTGGAGNPYDACESIINNLTGKIAVIERSGCTPPTSYFVNKAYKAQQAGAVGVIFIFNQPGNHVVTMGLPAGPNPPITIPLMLVSNDYGNTLKAEILAGPVNVSLSAPTVIANDECSFVAITHQQTFTPGNCPSRYTLVNTWTATDECGNAISASQTITVVDNTPPTLTVPANITLQNTDPLPLKPLNINSSPNNMDGTYNMGTALFGPPLTAIPVTGNLQLVNDGFGNPADACQVVTNNLTGKIAVVDRGTCLFTIKVLAAQNAGAIAVIVVNNQPGNAKVTMGGTNPLITIPSVFVSNNYGNALKASMALGTVNASLSASPVVATDICSEVVITYTKVITPVNCPGDDYRILNTWTATDACGNATSASQTITVVYALTSYNILGLKDVKLGENNTVNGSVGNTAAGKKVSINKNSTVNGFIKASVISLTQPVTVTGGTFLSPAVVTLPVMQLNTAAVPAGNFTVPDNATTAVNANYNNLTIGKNATVTVNGSIYGKITVKEGAQVSFTQSVIDVNEISADNGKSGPLTYTRMNFNGATVRVKNKITIGDRNRVNGNNTTFYMGDASPDAEKFTVNGNDTRVTANVYMPHGKLNVPGKDGLCIMTGRFIAEDIESNKLVTWNAYDCNNPPPPGFATPQPDITGGEEPVREIPVVEDKGSFAVKVYPNPSASDFTLHVISSSNETIQVRIFDVSGVVKSISAVSLKTSAIKLGGGLAGGTYFAEVTQGTNRQVVKLVKLN